MSGFKLYWSDNFAGTAGSPAPPKNWKYETPTVAQNNNGEIQQYTNSPLNANLSGSNTLYITPLYSSGTWTSARLSTWKSFGCDNNSEMILQASIKMGQNDPIHQTGFWPAFWTLGSRLRNNTASWPRCGEWDIMEQWNGSPSNLGTVHYGNDYYTHESLSSDQKAYDHTKWHTYGVRVSRVGDWTVQSITWEMDGWPYFTVTGADVGSYDYWVDLVGWEYYVLLNIAVGGSAPMPNGETWDGLGSGMEVGYVAVYKRV